MTSPEAKRPRHYPSTLCAWLCLLVALLATAPATAQGEDEPQAWLLTYGPGEIYWQRFGHNAIWIRDPARGLDHTFNYGFFDFAQEGFLRNFLLGRLNYFAAARPADVELAEYIDDNRSVRAQRLNLMPEQLEQLTAHVLDSVRPENREYLYDYYLNNCSTRVRDALDVALNGALGADLKGEPSPLDFRDHTRRLTGMDYWYYLGLMTGLGSPVDRAVDKWEALFIPGMVAEAMMALQNPATGGPAVIEDVMLYESTLPEPPEAPRSVWLSYLLIPALLLVVMAALVRLVPGLKPRHMASGWLALAGLLGCVLAFLWLFTDHWVSSLNLNLLLLNPVWLLVAFVPFFGKPGAWLILFAGLMGVLAPWLPPAQYNAEVSAVVWPLNLAAALALLLNSRRTTPLLPGYGDD